MSCGCCCRSMSTTSSSRCSASFRSATIRRCWRSTFPAAPAPRSGRFVTYSLLHANLSHIGFNVLWLLPFGSALARRFGAVRFFVFMAVTAVAGALAHLVTHEHAVAPMIGASASVSGTMAAAIRFAFVQGSFLSFSRGDADAAAQGAGAVADARAAQRAACWVFSRSGSASTSSSASDRSRSARTAPASPGRRISADFFAGLMLFSLFDPVPRGAADAADASSHGCCRIAADRRLRRSAISFIICSVTRQRVSP